MNKLNRVLYKIGLYHIGYANKFLTPALRVVEPLVEIANGLLGLLLIFTPYVADLQNKFLRHLIRAQMDKRIKALNAAKL